MADDGIKTRILVAIATFVVGFLSASAPLKGKVYEFGVKITSSVPFLIAQNLTSWDNPYQLFMWTHIYFP